MPDRLFRARRVEPENYWRFGRILALLGIWYQSGLLLFMLFVLVGRDYPDGAEAPPIVGAILLVLLGKNAALYAYSLSRAGVDDRASAWVWCLALDVGLAIIVLPALAPGYLRAAEVPHFLGLHYALAAVLRWRSRLSYVSLLVPSAFFLRDLALYERPIERLFEAGGFFLLGFLFIVATREAFVRNTANVEGRAATEYVLATELFAMNSAVAASVDAGLNAHREIITPFARLHDALNATGRSAAAAVIADVVSQVRHELERQDLFAVDLSLGAALGIVKHRLAAGGIDMRLVAPADLLPAFVEPADVDRFLNFAVSSAVRGADGISLTVRRDYAEATGASMVAFVTEQRDFRARPDPTDERAQLGEDDSLTFLIRLLPDA